MKKYFSLLLALFFLGACSKSNTPSNFDPHAMPGMPCHKMGDTYMGDCEFDENGNLLNPNDHTGHSTSKAPFSQETEGLTEAKPSEVVELKDGDTYEMTAGLVKQEVGGREVKRLAYNGQIPGPLLKVPQNAEINLVFKNELDIDTTLHSHGLRLDNAFDGVPGVTQKTIQPGETFTYKLRFPDEGIYWYHPHVREDYAQELGLYGNFLVDPSQQDYWSPVNREVAWMLDDLLVDETQPQFSKTETDHSLMGRFGNVMLLNNEENYQLKVKQGELIRFYTTNVANVRTFNLSIQDTPLKLVGGDMGRIEKEVEQNQILLAPAERSIFEAKFDHPGTFTITHQTPEKTYTLGQIVVEGKTETVGNFEDYRDNSADFKTIRDQLDALLEKVPDKSLKLSVDMMGMGDMGMSMMHQDAAGGIEWEDEMGMMNSASTSENTTWKIIDEQTGKSNMDIDWSFKKGDLVKIKIFNDQSSIHPMQHPIHFHGQRFLILTRDGKTNDNFQWKDTALIQTGETVELLVEMSNPGKWMAHCHIAEHLHSGMMMEFNVQ